MHWQSLHPGPPAWNGGAWKLRLRPSVCFCSITAPGAQGAPVTRLYSSEEESPFRCTVLFPLSNHVLLHERPSPQRTLLGLPGNIFQIRQSPELGCSAAAPSSPTGNSEQAAPHPASMSRNRSVLSWTSSCVGALTAEASSVLTAAASGLKHRHLLMPPPPPTHDPFPPLFLTPSVYPH